MMPDHLRKSFALNELTSAAYQFRLRPTEAEALAILRTAYHTCGHGEDTVPPVELALRHFRTRPFTPEFFDAVRTYRTVLRNTKHTTAQQLKGRLDLILWQDLRQDTSWDSCWTARIRNDVRTMAEQQRMLWRDLFQGFQHCVQLEPTKKWFGSCTHPLARISPSVFGRQLVTWISQESKRQITATGSHILKNLVWCATLIHDPAVDLALTEFVEAPWKTREPLGKVAGALAYLWSLREHERAIRPLERIAKLYGYPEGKVEHYLRTVRDSDTVRG